MIKKHLNILNSMYEYDRDFSLPSLLQVSKKGTPSISQEAEFFFPESVCHLYCTAILQCQDCVTHTSSLSHSFLMSIFLSLAELSQHTKCASSWISQVVLRCKIHGLVLKGLRLEDRYVVLHTFMTDQM